MIRDPESKSVREEEARIEWAEAEAPDLLARWKVELQNNGIIEDLGYEQADINLLCDERNMDADDLLKEAAYEYAYEHADDIIQERSAWY